MTLGTARVESLVSTTTDHSTNGSMTNARLRGLPEGFEAQDWGPGKTVLITGGSTGIGRALALLLGSRGARVMICGRQRAELDDALGALRELGADANGVVADVSRPSDVATLFEQADDWMGPLDVLVNNAGLAAEDVAATDVDAINYIVSTNLLGQMYCTHHALQRMRTRKSGTIVNVGSMSADIREQGSSVYVATKSGIQGFSAALRKEVGEDGIRIVLVEPGETGTDMNENSPEQQREKEQSSELLKAEDVALVILGALCMPPRADVVEISLRPIRQAI
jgi:NAD(P)-dependent dehydrogenase (short-subunit alcohol dehydrogenase family)